MSSGNTPSRVRLGLIGAGRAGMIHARTMSHQIAQAEMVAVADPSQDAGQVAAQELGIEHVFTDWHQLLEADIDAVIVVTPTKFHREIVVAAAQAGKHIFCEKPMAMDVEECRAMNDAAAAAGKVLQIGFMRRFDAGFRRAKRAIDEGEIGDVVSVRSVTHGPSHPHPWMFDLKASNGPLAEVSSHDIDTVRWLTGSEAATVYAVGGNFRSEEARAEHPDFYDTVLMTTTMRNGMIGLVDGAQGVQYGYDAQVEVIGTRGKISVGDLMADRTTIFTSDKSHHRDTQPSWTSLFKEAYAAEDAAFIESVIEGKPAQVTGEDGLRAVQLVQAGNESMAKGQIITVED